MRQRSNHGSGAKRMIIDDMGINTMNVNEVKPVDTRQQLFEFMLEMPEIYGYERDHLTHAERKSLSQETEEIEE